MTVTNTSRYLQVRRTLRVLWFMMIASMGWVSYVFYRVRMTPVAPFFILVSAAITIAVMSFILPGFVSRRIRPQSGVVSSEAKLGMTLIHFILRFAFTESALIFLTLANPYPGTESSLALFGFAVALMVMHFPREERFAELMRA